VSLCKASIVVLLFSLTVLLTSCPPGDTGPVILFSERFENGYDNTWTTTSALYTWSFQALAGLTGGNPSSSGSYAYSQANTDANVDLFNDSRKYFFSDITPSYVRFYVRAGQTDKEGGYVSFWGPNPWPGVVWFHFQGNGVMYANNQPLGAYTANTWYKIEFRNIDFTTDTYDVYVDDVLAIDDRAMNGAVDAFGALAIYNIDAVSQFYYDDILIQE
jgi:hypothetical protein